MKYTVPFWHKKSGLYCAILAQPNEERRDFLKSELDDEVVEQEISVLKESPFVALARKAKRAKYQKRQRLYILRHLERRGRELHEAGVTMESLSEQMRREREAWDDDDALF